MKWKCKPYPINGEVRNFKWFAWHPIRLENKEWVWLEPLIITKEFYSGYAGEWWITTDIKRFK